MFPFSRSFTFGCSLYTTSKIQKQQYTTSFFFFTRLGYPPPPPPKELIISSFFHIVLFCRHSWIRAWDDSTSKYILKSLSWCAGTNATQIGGQVEPELKHEQRGGEESPGPGEAGQGRVVHQAGQGRDERGHCGRHHLHDGEHGTWTRLCQKKLLLI